jgi:predicted NBD/HSP70 family sugar kinase
MIIAVDTGGTKTLVAAFSDAGTLLRESKFPTPIDEREYLLQLEQTIHEIAKEMRIDIIVVAMPGQVRNGVVRVLGNLPWKNFDVVTPLKHAFPDVPVEIENDANLGGLGEVRRMKTIPQSALYVTISTGIGTGFISDGVIDQGLRMSEGGHSLVEYDGNVQRWEAFASGKAIYTTYGKFARDIHSKRVWNQIADRISRGFLAVIPLSQPDVIIIGGSIGTYFDRSKDTLVGLLKEQLPSFISVPSFSKAKDAEKAVIYGCYFYGHDYLSR